MIWRHSYNVMLKDRSDYYSVIDLPTFYEWKYQNAIPKGTTFTVQMPRSDAPGEGMIIIAANLDQSSLQELDGKWRLNESVPPRMKLIAGNLQSPSEVATTFLELSSRFDRNMENFKQRCSVRRYFLAGNKENHLYRIGDWKPHGVLLQNLGPARELDEKMTVLKARFDKESTVKQGRAIEAVDATRFQQAMLKLKSGHLPLDDADLDFIVQKGEIKPHNSRFISWSDCFVELDQAAAVLNDKIKSFNGLKWVRDLAYL